MSLEVSIVERKIIINKNVPYSLGMGLISILNNYNLLEKRLIQSLLIVLYNESDDIDIKQLEILHPAFGDKDFLYHLFFSFINDFLAYITSLFKVKMLSDKDKSNIEIEYDKLKYLFEKPNSDYYIRQTEYDRFIKKILKSTSASSFRGYCLNYETYKSSVDNSNISEPVLFYNTTGTYNVLKLVKFVYTDIDENLKDLDVLNRFHKFCENEHNFNMELSVNFKTHKDSKNNIYFSELFTIENLSQLIFLESLKVIQNQVHINKCINCGKYFIPTKRIDEKYCTNIFKNNKTCRDLGYEITMNSNEFKKAYRRIYKTKNTAMHRNKKFNKSAEKKYKEWNKNALNQLERAMNGELNLDEFIELIK